MKILFFTRLFYPHIGGVEKHVLKISEILIGRGHEVTVVTEKYDEDLKDKEIYKKIKIYRVPTGHSEFLRKFKIWGWLWRNKKIINKAAIIHCHDIFYWYLPFRFLLPRKKVYVTFHGYEGNKIPDLRSKTSHKIAEVLTEGNVCVGDYLAKWYGTNPTFVTYGAVDVISNFKRYKSGTAVFVGRLEEEASIMSYLKALNVLAKKNVIIKLTVLGDGTLREEAENYVKQNKLSVNFLGFVDDVYEHLDKFEYIFTSRFLGTLEGLSVKRAVYVVYNNRILKDCFYMSPFKNMISISPDYAKLANTIEAEMKHRKNKAEQIETGYNWAIKQTWDKMVSIYITLWSNGK